MCGAKNKVRILVYLMQREEAKHRKFVKINLALSIFMACFLFWTVSLPADLITNIGILYFAGLTLLLGAMALFDHLQAKVIRREISEYDYKKKKSELWQ